MTEKQNNTGAAPVQNITEAQKTPLPARGFENRMQQKSKTYYLILLCIIAVLLAGLLLGNLVFKRYLTAYENAAPENVAKEAFAAYYASGNYRAWIGRSCANAVTAEEINLLSDQLANRLNPETMQYKKTAEKEDAIDYSVAADGEIISTFKLIPSNDTAGFGLKHWILSDMTLDIAGETDITIRVPEAIFPTVNGVALDETSIIGTESAPVLAHLPQGLQHKAMRYLIYQCNDLLFSPDVVLMDADGNQYTALYRDEIHQYYYDAFPCDTTEEDAAMCSALAIEAEQTVEAYFAFDDTQNLALTLVMNNTALHDTLIAYTGADRFVHDTAAFSDARVSEFVRYDEFTFSCRVMLTHTMTNQTSGETRVENNDVTLIMVDTGNGVYQIYDRYEN